MKNKLKYLSLSIVLMGGHITVLACEVCKKQQPKITQGLTHGVGPQSNWDWVIISLITAIAILTLVYSLKYLIHPNEKNLGHIKQSIFK
jgi:hypothetical protein